MTTTQQNTRNTEKETEKETEKVQVKKQVKALIKEQLKAHIKMKIKTEIKTEIKNNNNKFICCSIDFIKSYCNNIEDLRNLQNAVNKFNSNVIKKGYLENK